MGGFALAVGARLKARRSVPSTTVGVQPPINSVAPAVTGTPQDGEVLTTTNGTFTGAPTGYARQWYTNTIASVAGRSAVAGQVGLTWTPGPAHVGLYAFCGVVASNAGGPSALAFSNIVGPIAAIPAGLDAPILTLTSTPGTNPMSWSGAYNNTLMWDGAGNGDKVRMRFRVNGGAWATEADQVLDSDQFLLPGFAWPTFDATSFPGGSLVEVQEQKARFVSNVETQTSAWSTTLSDTMSGSSYAPTDLTAARLKFWLDPSTASSVKSDTAGTTNATLGSTMKRINDLSGNGKNFVETASYAIDFAANAGKNYIYFNGNSGGEKLASSSTVDLSGVDEFYLFIVAECRYATSGAPNSGIIAEHTANANVNGGHFLLHGIDGATHYRARVAGTNNSDIIDSGNNDNTPYLVRVHGDRSSDLVEIYVDGVLQQSTTATDLGNANLANATYYLGNRSDNSIPWTGRIYQAALVGGSMTSGEIADMETFMLGKKP